MRLIVNPWSLYASGNMDLTVEGDHYRALLAVDHEEVAFTVQTTELTNSYEYEELKGERDIRLLEIYPDNEQEMLRGRVYDTNLDVEDGYIAISYTWGPALKPYRVHSSVGDLPIPASLHSALKRVRSSEQSVTVWADAICIHQRNESEKVRQIKLLPVIFGQAKQVFGWVGDMADYSDLAIKALQSVAQPETEQAFSEFDDKKWKAVSEFFERPWFVRSWIIQEIILAKDLLVVCGSQTILWQDLYEAVRNCQEHAKRSVGALNIPLFRNMNAIVSLGETRHGFWSGSQKYSLLQLLELFQHAKSTMKCDRLFTLLNVAADGGRLNFKPDYSSPLEVIVRRYGSEFVDRKQTFELLYRARLSNGEDFPSWTPDWTSNQYPKTISSWQSEPEFSALGVDREQAGISPLDDRLLLIDGCEVDKIAKVGNCTSEVHDALEYIADIFDFIELNATDSQAVPKDELKRKLPIGSAARAPWGEWVGQDFNESFLALTEYLALRNGQDEVGFTAGHSPAETTERLSQLHEKLWLFLFTAIEFSERFQPAVACLTNRGYFGLVPANAREGDIIAVLYGGAVPFCLRRSDDEETCRVVGEAYVHGIMHGEAIGWEGMRDETFQLK